MMKSMNWLPVSTPRCRGPQNDPLILGSRGGSRGESEAGNAAEGKKLGMRAPPSM